MSQIRNPFEQPSFVNPWSLRVFAVTLAAAESGIFSLQEFQQALISEIRKHEAQGHGIDSDESYYTRWTEALTALLLTRKLLTQEQLGPVEQAARDAVAALQHAREHHDHQHLHCDARPQPRPLFVEAAQ